jgi:APA family basic amino acid/polyamine antiporter
MGDRGPAGLMHATALMFVAYTGYGRIATLGEEVREPRRTIPLAIVGTLAVTVVVYVSVAWVAVGLAGPDGLAAATTLHAAPLEVVARGLPFPWVSWWVGAAALTAMAGVLLNLLLGLSRVVLAMGRRGDLPRGLSSVGDGGDSPRRAVYLVGVVVASMVAVGDVETTWSFSAFTVLVYYALTNLAALRLPREHRRYPRWVPAGGLVSCLALAFWVDAPVWGAGLALLGIGAVWHRVARRLRPGG